MALVLWLGGYSHNLQAQLLEQDTARWQLAVGHNLFYSEGNVDRLLNRSDASIKYLAAKWGAASESQYLFGTFGPRVTENDVLSKHFVYLWPRARWYPYAMVWTEATFRRRVDQRYLLGLGLSWVAIRAKQYHLKLSATAGWEQAQYGRPRLVNLDDQTDHLQEPRAVARLYGWVQLPKLLKLTYEAWYQHAWVHASNKRLFAQASLQVPVHPSISLRATTQYSYDQIHVQGTEDADLYLTFGLQWAFSD